MARRQMPRRTKTLMYPNIDSVGLSKIQLILYSKFCAATAIPQNDNRGTEKKRGKRTERVQKRRPIFAFIDCNLTTGSSYVRAEVERFP